MVISLESQNVRVKRTNNFEFRIPNFKINMPDIRINSITIPFIVGIVVFSIIFAGGCDLFIPAYPTEADLNCVVLPVNRADVISKNEIAGYSFTVLDSYYREESHHINDTISTLAIKYGVSRESILNINSISDIKKLDSLKVIKIPISNGYLHRVSSRDTLEYLSRKYSVPIKDIFRVNGLKSENISDIEAVFIPGVNPTEWGWHTNIDRYFVYPVDGYITKRYGLHTNSITGITSLYEGLDLSPIDDSFVYASRSGYVSRIGYSANYGNYIYIDHSGGIRTLYANLNNVSVSVREHVGQGYQIASVKETLFFSVFNRGESVNPENYLR